MKHLFCILHFTFCILLFAACNDAPRELRVMTFNIWMGGGTSLTETAKVIRESRADIVGIQESTPDDVRNCAIDIADSLGLYSYWNGGSTTILSRYAIVDTSAAGYGVKIQLDKKRFVWMFNIHLFYCPYEPYQLNGIEYCGAPLLDTPEEAVASAWETRGENVLEIIDDIKTAQKEGFPVFLTGDFNEPSYLDWTKRAVQAKLCSHIVQWPAAKTFTEQANMQDSYRAVYPDEVAKPGHTWTPRPAENEIPDRIDFVFYWGKVKPVKSEIAGEDSELSDIRFKNYPSDHRAVVGAFEYR
ncbi:MAG: endonuclease/exonuclease/phosphatase family protein [Dysgonamonadaceae bacterium]|nr:endonuclease/exonuclease/phosphatase family protein [Dysgonamonadaceae bacterium]